MIYLAGPYAHEDPKVREERFEALTKKAAELMNTGNTVFSPITHGHAMAVRHDMPKSHDFWLYHDFRILRHCSKIIILRLDGWVESKGVNAEIELAKTLNIDIEYHPV